MRILATKSQNLFFFCKLAKGIQQSCEYLFKENIEIEKVHLKISNTNNGNNKKVDDPKK